MSNYTAADAERAGKNADAFKEDNPPSIRFEEDTAEDRQESIKQGRFVHTPRLMAYLRARGDDRSEVPFVVKGHRFEPKMVEREVEKPVFRTVKQEDGSFREEETTITETIQEEYQFKVDTTPWEDKLKHEVRHGFKSKAYLDYCMDAVRRYEAGQEAPINGTDIRGWNQVSMAVQKNLIDIGINTVELAAEMTEEAMDSIGMGSRDIKRKAKAFITTTDQGQSSAKITALENELARSKDQGDTLAAKFADLEERIKLDEAPAKKKPGRPVK